MEVDVKEQVQVVKSLNDRRDYRYVIAIWFVANFHVWWSLYEI
jgi:hypothetical protein